MIVVSVEVLVHMGGFPVYRGCTCVIGSWRNWSVKKGKEPLSLGFSMVNWIWVSMDIIVLEELVTMFSLLDDKGVILIT